MLTIKKILTNPDYYSKLAQVEVWGRIYSLRVSKKLIFADITDGSIGYFFQIIVPKEILPSLTLGSVIKIRGKLILVPERDHQLELRVENIDYLSLGNPEFKSPFKWLRVENPKTSHDQLKARQKEINSAKARAEKKK